MFGGTLILEHGMKMVNLLVILLVLVIGKPPGNQGRHYGTLHKRENFVLKRCVIANASIMPPLVSGMSIIQYNTPPYNHISY